LSPYCQICRGALCPAPCIELEDDPPVPLLLRAYVFFLYADARVPASTKHARPPLRSRAVHLLPPALPAPRSLFSFGLFPPLFYPSLGSPRSDFLPSGFAPANKLQSFHFFGEFPPLFPEDSPASSPSGLQLEAPDIPLSRSLPLMMRRVNCPFPCSPPFKRIYLWILLVVLSPIHSTVHIPRSSTSGTLLLAIFPS